MQVSQGCGLFQLGGDDMRMLAKTCVILAVCLAMTGSAMAGRGSKRSVATGSAVDARTAQRAKAVERLRPLIMSGYDPSGSGEDEQAAEQSAPFVALLVPGKPLYLGEVYGPGLKEVGAQVNAHVVANCPYHILVSFDGLRHERSRVEISPKHMTATVNGKSVPIGVGRVPVASQGPTPPGGVDVPIELQLGVKSMAMYPAGRYGGTLVLTVTAGH
jgi:hypothetical protein